jgi:hypothetical protein
MSDGMLELGLVLSVASGPLAALGVWLMFRPDGVRRGVVGTGLLVLATVLYVVGVVLLIGWA